ncbi:MAG: pantetheine-phosphate adenylyltransferase [Candidatus Levybacteria bacterium]|nr:pantetheine-phosphate adenylyltransferase [Candidatus Levybacteria bacterium]
MKYSVVICGGTFDHFHKGHRMFLRHVFSVGKEYIVGITSDEFVRRWKIDGRSWTKIEAFEERKRAILEFIKKEGVLNKAEIVKIDDLFGPTLDKSLVIDAIVVSENTKKGAEIINERRKKIGLKKINLSVAPQVLAQDGKLISSGRIRNGEINREGKLYVNPLWLKSDLILPQNLRRELKKPLGSLTLNVPANARASAGRSKQLIVTVGDITTKKINELKLNQQVSVVDFKVGRQKKFSNTIELGFLGSERIVKVNNPPSSITAELFRACLTVWNKGRVIILIDGEEDLAVLPIVLFAPLNIIVYYGQPGQGVVKVVVSEESKEKAYNLVLKLKSA